MLPWTRKIHFSKKSLIVFAIMVFFVILGFSSQVFAQSATDTLGIDVIDQNAALASTDLRVIIIRIINTVLALLGVIAVSLIVYAGFIWMTSGGDDGKVATAKKIIINAVIGLVVILSAFAIVKFVFDKLLNTQAGGGQVSSAPVLPPAIQTFSGSGSLGRIIKDHYPYRNQKEVARNTSVVVTFNVPFDPATIVNNGNNTCWNSDLSGPTLECGPSSIPYYGDCITTAEGQKVCDTLKTTAVKIDILANIGNENAGVPAIAKVAYDADLNAFSLVLKPSENLGSASENIDYTVVLSTEIKKTNTNESVLPRPYAWDFQTSTNLDLTPPYVVKVSPSAGEVDTKDSVIKINFNEPIDPTTVGGVVEDGGIFDNLIINTEGKLVAGIWKPSNGYKTVEFIPTESCGQNSCGQVKYCLPISCPESDPYCIKDFTALVRTAEPSGNAGAPFEAEAFTGVYDLALNALDNPINESNELVKPPIVDSKIISNDEKTPDNYFWDFKIINKIDKSSPYITTITPNPETSGVASDTNLELNFSKKLLYSSIENINLVEYPEKVCADAANVEDPCSTADKLDDIWFRTISTDIDDKTNLKIEHREFGPNGLDLYYFPTIPHTLQDSHQNCFYPGFGPMSGQACVIEYDGDGNITSKTNCSTVNLNADSDTSCIYSTIESTDSLNTCLDTLKVNSPSDYSN